MNSKEVLPVTIKAVLPTTSGSAVFLGNEKKVFVIYMDPLVGNSISLLVHGTKNERPLTHDLMGMLLTSLGAKVERVIINDLKGATYYGRMIITVENELQQRKVIELDARPSDCLAMASQQKAPIYVTRGVWEETEDMSEALRKMTEQASGDEKTTEERD
jgi:bifunctional DNase/RNase